MKNTSTMVQGDSQTCEVGVQVQDLALVDDRSRMDDDDVREVNEDFRETRVTEAKGKARKGGRVKENKQDTDKRTDVKTKEKTAKVKTVQKCKEVDKDKGKENEVIHDESDNKGRVLRKRKSSQQEGGTSQNEAKAMAEKRQTATSTQEELQLECQTIAQTANSRDSWLASNASEEDDAPFQYSLTPRRLQNLEENNQSLEKYGVMTSGSTQDDISYSKEEEINSTKRREVVPKEFPRLEKCVEDNSNKEVLQNSMEVLEVNEDGFVMKPSQESSMENEKTGNVASEEQKSVLMEEDRDLFELHEVQDEEELPANSERTNADKDKESNELPGVEDVNEETRKNGKRESKRKRNAKQRKTAEEEVQENEGKIHENGADESNKSQGKRVLRSRAKECHSGVQLDTKKGQKRKALGTETRQKLRQDSAVETVVIEKCKPDGWDLKGRELTMLDKSTPETDQLPRETDMSSREIDRLVDEPRPSREVSVETSQQPEPEVLGRLNEGNTSSQGEPLRDYTSDQGRLVLNDNRMSTLEETIFDHCLHKDLEEGKSPCQNELHPAEQDDDKLDFCSKNTNIVNSGQQFQGIDVSTSKKRGSDSKEADYNTHFTQKTAKSTSRDTGRSRKDGQDPAGVSSKENAPDGKRKSRKKR